MRKIIAQKGSHTITVEADGGNTKVSVDGVAGLSCKDITASLEASLGKVQSSEPTSEMYQAAGGKVSAS